MGVKRATPGQDFWFKVLSGRQKSPALWLWQAGGIFLHGKALSIKINLLTVEGEGGGRAVS